MTKIPRDSKQLEAVYRVKYGEPVASVAKAFDLDARTLKRWVDGYTRPSAELLGDMIAEGMVDLLGSGIKGSDLSGMIAAYKVVTSGASADILSAMLDAGADDE